MNIPENNAKTHVGKLIKILSESEIILNENASKSNFGLSKEIKILGHTFTLCKIKFKFFLSTQNKETLPGLEKGFDHFYGIKNIYGKNYLHIKIGEKQYLKNTLDWSNFPGFEKGFDSFDANKNGDSYYDIKINGQLITDNLVVFNGGNDSPSKQIDKIGQKVKENLTI